MLSIDELLATDPLFCLEMERRLPALSVSLRRISLTRAKLAVLEAVQSERFLDEDRELTKEFRDERDGVMVCFKSSPIPLEGLLANLIL